MKEDWVEISFGIEKLEDYEKWIYKGGWSNNKKKWDVPDENNPAGMVSESKYGEVSNKRRCEQAISECRMFSYRIRYEPQ